MIEKRKVFPLKDGCYKPAAKSRTYSVAIKPDEHKEQEIFQQSEYFRDKSKYRYKIEAKNSELKNVHGYDSANSYALESMRMQGGLAIFVVKLKKILKF